MTSDSYSLNLIFRLMCLFLHTSCSLPNTLLALIALVINSINDKLIIITTTIIIIMYGENYIL